jgi:rhodanese-related sulfurtransferase
MKTSITLVIALLTQCAWAQKITFIQSTSVDSLRKKNPQVVVLDVRTPGEFSQGHIPGAINMDVNNPDTDRQYNMLDKQKTYVVVCRTKNRSGVVSNKLVSNGFTNVFQVVDGMVGWNQNRLRVEK